jgi:hypothetical protein
MEAIGRGHFESYGAGVGEVEICPLPWGEGVALPTLSSAGARRVRGRLSAQASFVAFGSNPSPVRRQLENTLSPDTLPKGEGCSITQGSGSERREA